MTQDLRELAEWLRQFGVTQVAMESRSLKRIATASEVTAR
jgi:hypothetical protein